MFNLHKCFSSTKITCGPSGMACAGCKDTPHVSKRCSDKIALMAATFSGLRSLCLALNKGFWITGETCSQYSCVRVGAGQWNDWSSGGLSARKNAVWWDFRLRGREGKGTGAEGGKQKTHFRFMARGRNLPNCPSEWFWPKLWLSALNGSTSSRPPVGTELL